MADTTQIQTLTERIEPEETQTMAEPDQTQSQPIKISISIWPPNLRTRAAVTSRLIEMLSTPSILSKRYGTMSAEEAAEAVKRIEEEAFVAAAAANGEGERDGIEVLQAYSKAICKRMLEAVKARSDGAVKEEVAAVKEEA